MKIEKIKKIQERLSKKVRCEPLKKEVSLIAGVDVSVKEKKGIACIVVMEYPEMRKVEVSIAKKEIRFPYIPGFLSFREGPVILKAIKKLKNIPDLFLFDGQGIAHPRGIGIASHIGVLIDMPTVGCAKSVLCGSYKEPGIEKGSWSPLIYKNRTVGAVLRTRKGVKPIVVSVGHRITLSQAIKIVLDSCKYRIPEPIRYAHMIAGNEMSI